MRFEPRAQPLTAAALAESLITQLEAVAKHSGKSSKNSLRHMRRNIARLGDWQRKSVVSKDELARMREFVFGGGGVNVTF